MRWSGSPSTMSRSRRWWMRASPRRRTRPGSGTGTMSVSARRRAMPPRPRRRSPRPIAWSGSRFTTIGSMPARWSPGPPSANSIRDRGDTRCMRRARGFIVSSGRSRRRSASTRTPCGSLPAMSAAGSASARPVRTNTRCCSGRPGGAAAPSSGTAAGVRPSCPTITRAISMPRARSRSMPRTGSSRCASTIWEMSGPIRSRSRCSPTSSGWRGRHTISRRCTSRCAASSPTRSRFRSIAAPGAPR